MLSYKILIVDDIADNLRLLSTTLSKQGYEVRCAKNGTMALTAASSYQPNLILLDINMPDLTGYQVCQRLKADPATAATPVIFLSAQDDVEDRVKAFTAGGVDFISKPFQIEEVLARVKNQLALHSAYSEIYSLNSGLEERVRERTSELRLANYSLEQEIRQRKEAEAQLRYNALHDRLTDLPNRDLLLDLIENCLDREQLIETGFAVILIDIDRFQIVNDSLGHPIGDELLLACADRLKDCLLFDTHLARLGGDEFALLVEKVEDIGKTIHLVEEVLRVLKRQFVIGGRQIDITASVGVAFSRGGYEHSIDILRDADTALYQAKKLGRARYEVFDPQMYAQTVYRLELEQELRQAIAKEELLLHYQPLFSICDRKLVGFEALVRWQHPRRGMISPGEFIPLAEETGSIVPLGNWVLAEACQQLKAWRDNYPAAESLSMGVNVAREQLSSNKLIPTIDRVLAQTKLNPRLLKIEITESMLIENSDRIQEVIQSIKERGIKLCLDDFGTGYSSLSYLPKFPIDILKIDRSFVMAMEETHQYYEIVKAIVTLAKALEMRVVAEGIETESQLANLQSLTVPLGQGYLFSKPLTAEDAEKVISQQKSLLAS